ncbi:LysR family transcriptional regulator [Phenylobacterium terrae]|uniref:LysR family transcriptional regulator n=1 Tax=Phenylobacterium terrae TaxID=2665495 RepID=A0ABW4N6S5_9CAUL
MDRLEVMRLFVRIVERANFSDAARDLQVPRASVTRAIQRLEGQLGVRLLERTTRAVRPTQDGALYYNRCIQVLADVDEVENAFREAQPGGPVRADLQGTLARFFVIPALPDFIGRYPDISLHLSEGDRMVDLISEGIDCVLRAGDLPNSSLVGRQVAASEQLTLASPGYLERHGVPESLDDLAGHRMVGYAASSTGQPYALDFVEDGIVREIELAYDILVRGAEIYTASAVAGLGLIQIPRYRVDRELRAGELVPVLTKHPPPRMPVSVLYPQRRHLPARVRVFADWMADIFQRAQTSGRL